MPTAVSVVADILDVARAIRAGSSGLLAGSVAVGERAELPIDAITTRYYLRFTVADRPKVMARLAGALGEAGVSIEQIVQEKNAGEGGAAEVVMITHRAAESDVRAALAAIAREDFVIAGPRLFRIEEVG
jgi:homoserine dehydrogenase